MQTELITDQSISFMAFTLSMSSVLFFVFLVLPSGRVNLRIRSQAIVIYSLFALHVIATIGMAYMPEWLYAQICNLLLLSICYQFDLLMHTITHKPIKPYYRAKFFYLNLLGLCTLSAGLYWIKLYAFEFSIFFLSLSGLFPILSAINTLDKPNGKTPRGYLGIKRLFHFICLLMLSAPMIIYYLGDTNSVRNFILIIIGFYVHITYGVLGLIISSENAKASYRNSITDAMTGLYNRRYFTQKAKSTLSKMSTYPLSLIIVDIDWFKKINDTYGHDIGDEVICLFTKALKEYFGESALVARLGGEEFAVLLTQSTAEQAHSKADYFRHTIVPGAVQLNNFDIRVSASFGVFSCTDEQACDLGSLMKKADIALYQAKDAGRDQVRIYNPKESVAMFYQSTQQ